MAESKRILLEICAYSVEAAVIAQTAGADRVELCANRLVHGTTPLLEDVARARERLKIPLHVMVRPRGGDFVYTDSEFSEMKEAIAACKEIGADGVVLGILLATADVDVKRCRELVELAGPMPVTFHRAFDVTRDSTKALEEIIEIGCERVLTSGRADTAMQGAGRIAELIAQAGERISVMPGAGVRAGNLEELIRKTGAIEFHSSACKEGELPDEDEIWKMRKIATEFSRH